MVFFKVFKRTGFLLMLIHCFLPRPGSCAQEDYTGLFMSSMKTGKFIALTGHRFGDSSEIITICPVRKIDNAYFRCIGIIEDKTADPDGDKHSLLKVKMKKTVSDEKETDSPYITLKRQLESLQIVDVLVSLTSDNPEEISFQREKIHVSSLGSKIYQINANHYNQIGFFDDPERLNMLNNYRSELKNRADSLRNAFQPGTPLKITFNDGTVLEGIMDYRDKSYFDQMLNISDLQDRIRFEEHPEFEAVQYKDVPYVVKDRPKRENFLKTNVTRLKPKEKKIKKQGLFTNKYTWMGRNNQSMLDNFYMSCSLLNDYQEISLYSLVIVDTELNASSLFINDIVNIKNIERFPFQTQDYQDLFNRIRDMHETLKICWEERNNENLYIEFYGQPPFKGKLVEYVEGYHLTSIPHAVVKDDNNRAVLLRNMFDIKLLELESLIDETEKNEFDLKVKLERAPVKSITVHPVKTDTPVKDEKPENIVKIVSDKSFTSGIELGISSVKVQNTNSPYAGIIDRITINPENPLNACVVDISLTDNTVTEESPKWIFFEEFNVYSESGKTFDTLALINSQAHCLTDVINMDKNTASFSLLVYIPEDTSKVYLKYLDMPPLEINITEKIKQPE